MNIKEIHEVGVDIDHKDIKNCQSANDIKKLETFSHLSEEKQSDAEQRLLWFLKNPSAEIHPDDVKKEEVVNTSQEEDEQQ